MRCAKVIGLLCAAFVCVPAFGQTAKWREVDVRANPHSNYAAQQRSYLPIEDCHYVTEQYTVQVSSGHYETRCVPAREQVVYDECGRPCRTRTVPGYCERRWVPPRYETRRFRAYRTAREIRTMGPDPCVTVGWTPDTGRDRVDYPTLYRYRYDERVRSERAAARRQRSGRSIHSVADTWR